MELSVQFHDPDNQLRNQDVAATIQKANSSNCSLEKQAVTAAAVQMQTTVTAYLRV